MSRCLGAAALAAVAAACISQDVRAAPGPELRKPSRSEAVSMARDVLGGARFQKTLPGPEKARPVRNREIELPAGGATNAGGILVSVIAWTAIAVVLALLVWASVSALARWGALSRLVTFRKAVPEVAASVVAPIPSGEALSAAERKASDGFYLDAVRMLFIDSARMVEEAAAVRLERTSTNGEYLRSLPAPSKYVEVMSAIAMVVDACFYGNRVCTREDWLACRSAFESLGPVAGGGWV